METGNRKWKWKLETEMEMHQSLVCGIAHAQGRYCGRHRIPRGDGTVCGDGRRHQIQPHQPRRLEGRASLAEGCASNPIVLDDEDSFASSGSICFFTNLYVA